jgi:hypothetical protein
VKNKDTRKLNSNNPDFEAMERIRRGIRRIKRERGLCLKDLSVKTGYSDPFLCRLLWGRRKLSSTHLKRLSKALKIPVSAFSVPKQDDELLYDKSLTPEENRELERRLCRIRKELVTHLIKSRRKKKDFIGGAK